MVKCAGVLLKPREFPCDLIYLISIDTTEVLRRVENAATTIRNNKGMLERVEESFRRLLNYYIDNNGGHFEHFV
jgi:ribosomal protein S6